jgi:uncharacterized membrane protein
MSIGDTPAAPATPRRAPRWLTGLLIVSLAFNLFVIGAVIAHHFGWREGGMRHARFASPAFTQLLPRRFFSDLGEERRRELVALMQAHRREFRRDQGELKDSAQAVAEALAAEPFDAARLDQALDDFAGRGRALVDMGAAIAKEVAGKLTPEERKMLAEHLRKRSERRARKPAKDKDD